MQEIDPGHFFQPKYNEKKRAYRPGCTCGWKSGTEYLVLTNEGDTDRAYEQARSKWYQTHKSKIKKR
jgi:hypothetical protein